MLNVQDTFLDHLLERGRHLGPVELADGLLESDEGHFETPAIG